MATETKTHFHAGWNMVGYMPEMEPATFETFEDARDWMVEEMERWADHLEDFHDKDSEVAEMIEAAESLATETGPEWGDIVSNESFWINACSETECQEDEDY